MNSMLKNRKIANLSSQIEQFKQNLKSSGKSPEQLLNELLASGRYSNQQIEQAKKMAMLFANKI